MLSGKSSTITLDSCPDWVMPNAGGAGYWRFVTDAGNAAALRDNYASLKPAEQMMLTDSINAGFSAGKVSAADMVAGLEAATTGSAPAISASIDMIGTLKASLDADGKVELADWVEANYGPVGEYLFDRPATALTTSERLLAPKLCRHLAPIN